MGLLDTFASAGGGGGGLFGSGWDDPRTMATLQLAAGLMGGRNLGQGLAAGLQGYQAAIDGAQDRETRGLLTRAKIEDYRSEAAVRQAKLAQDAQLQEMIRNLFGSGGAPGAPAAGGTTSAAPSGASSVGGARGTTQGGGIESLSPTGVALFKLAGKDLTDIWKETRPDMQVTNGYAYDRRQLQPGFLPSLNVSSTGQALMTLPGPNGLPVAMVPQGAAEAYGTYQGIDAGIRAANTPGRPVLGPDGRQHGQSQAQEIGGAPRAGAPGGSYRSERDLRGIVAGGMGPDPAVLQREIDEATAGLRNVRDPQARADLQGYIAGLQRQQAAIGGAPAAGASSPAGALDFSPAEKAEQEARRASAVGTANADVVRDTASQAEQKKFGQLSAGVARALELLKQGPTGSGFGRMVDAGASFFGGSTQGADLGAQLSTLSGWLTSNVPRMEGPQSDKDSANYAVMAGRVGDPAIPVAQRIAAAQELQGLIGKYSGAQRPAQGGGATGSWAESPKPANLLPELPTANRSNMGKIAIDHDTGKRYRSDGMSWKEVK